jgi:hypothetical protein
MRSFHPFSLRSPLGAVFLHDSLDCRGFPARRNGEGPRHV